MSVALGLLAASPFHIHVPQSPNESNDAQVQVTFMSSTWKGTSRILADDKPSQVVPNQSLKPNYVEFWAWTARCLPLSLTVRHMCDACDMLSLKKTQQSLHAWRPVKLERVNKKQLRKMCRKFLKKNKSTKKRNAGCRYGLSAPLGPCCGNTPDRCAMYASHAGKLR